MGDDQSDRDWPVWWHWPLEFTPHLMKRMVDRDFTEVDLRTMLEEAGGFVPDVEPGRWIIEASHGGRAWHVIVEPDETLKLLVIVTAYPLG